MNNNEKKLEDFSPEKKACVALPKRNKKSLSGSEEIVRLQWKKANFKKKIITKTDEKNKNTSVFVKIFVAVS